jgi:hypothetical protein
MSTKEHERIAEITDDSSNWRRWGPYLSDRSWATVREDYSATGDAWGYLPHDLARSKTYRWGEDGIAGISDRYQLLCFAPAFWNGRDTILKERFFGVTPHEGNHGEDVKEYYFHLDNTPTHSYMRLLYKYPHAEFPYALLEDENRRRSGQGYEYELLDTGVFANNRYFDIEIEYAKASPEDICIRLEVSNRGPEPAVLHVLPHLWFRNIWAWGPEAWGPNPPPTPEIRLGPIGPGYISILADDTNLQIPAIMPGHYRLGHRTLAGPSSGIALFTNNETNGPRVFGTWARSRTPHVKDAFHRYLINGEHVINTEQRGTKATLYYRLEVPAGGSVVLPLRLSNAETVAPLSEVEKVVALRKQEADEFYKAIQPAKATEDEKLVQRQAFAGLLWSKQSYLFDVHSWLAGDNPQQRPPESRWTIRNQHWLHLTSLRVLTMPDKWEYPWFAAWDLAFHTVAFAAIDGKFAKDQLWLLLFEQFQHPNGQIPAYEWEFSDLNPPVHAWAVWRVYNMDRIRSGKPDRDFLEKCFHKLLINFAWWINKVDREGNNIFEGGFLGLDNITVIDRSEKLPDGAVLQQADATGWMGMFCLTMMRMALELAKENPVYEGLATKYFQHYALVAGAMKRMGGRQYNLWDEEDGFFYDVLSYPNGDFRKFRVRSLVGLIPLFAVERLEFEWIKLFPSFTRDLKWFLKNRPDLTAEVVHQGNDAHVLTIVNLNQLERMLRRLCDPNEFMSPYGVRSLSKAHEREPFWFNDRKVGYEPAEATSKIKGGNSNWRGPIWFPTSFLMIESLRKLRKAYGKTFQIDIPTEGLKTFKDMGSQIANRLISIFTRDEATGLRPVHGGTPMFQKDPYWRDLVLFYEYFHGDNGAGLGASHQTGWTALVASLIDEWRSHD